MVISNVNVQCTMCNDDVATPRCLDVQCVRHRGVIG